MHSLSGYCTETLDFRLLYLASVVKAPTSALAGQELQGRAKHADRLLDMRDPPRLCRIKSTFQHALAASHGLQADPDSKATVSSQEHLDADPNCWMPPATALTPGAARRGPTWTTRSVFGMRSSTETTR